MAAAAVLSLVTVFFSRLFTRFSPVRVLPLLFTASAVGLALEWVLGLAAPAVAAIAVYLQTAIIGPALLSTSWSVINERFDSHAAKPAVARSSRASFVTPCGRSAARWIR